MTLEELINEMVTAANKYPGIDLILYREIVSTTVALVSTFVGIAAVALTVGLPIILAVELLCLNFPPLTAAIVEQESFCEAAGVEKKRRNWGLFLNDVRKALRIHAEEGKNINLCYFRVKWKTLFGVGTTVALLFSGQDAIVRMVTKLVAPILARLAGS